MRTFIFTCIALLGGGCLYTGEQTLGLPCNTDLECGGDQLCTEHVCGGPQGTSSGATDGSTGSDGTSEGATPGDDESVQQSCMPADSMCLEDDVFRMCTDEGKLETIGCPGRCGQTAPSFGCFDTPDGPGCVCGDARESCTQAGELACLDGQNLSQCTDGLREPLDCDTTCVNAGYGGATNCGPGEVNDTCFCDTTCQDGARRCVDEHNAADCVGGSWSSYDCQQACIDSGFSITVGCAWFGPGQTDSCICL